MLFIYSFLDHLGNEIDEMTSAQLQNKWPCNYDRYLAINEVTINGKQREEKHFLCIPLCPEVWIESVLAYLDDSVAVGKVRTPM